MNTLICAGGSGLRTLEAMLHLCAAGLGPPKLRLLAIDPDGANGNRTRAIGLLEKYRAAQRRFAGKLGTGLNLFGTELDLLVTPGHQPELRNWSPVEGSQKLSDLLNFDGLSATDTPTDVVKLLFTRDELQMELDQGFRGHPAIGAACMSLVTLHEREQPWELLVQQIQGDLAQPQGSRVFLVGSVFGGTGASAIHPIVRFLRGVPDAGHERLKIGVGAIVPYFRFAVAAADERLKHSEMAAKSERFPLATQAAVQYYEHLRSNGDWPFDVMYWVGDSSPVPVDYCPGGPDQKNPPHFVDLLSAFSALEFFRDPDARRGSCYAGPRSDAAPELGDSNLLDWPDLPLTDFQRSEVQKTLLRLSLVGAMHSNFFSELFSGDDFDRRPYCIPWYFKRFALTKSWFSTRENREDLTLLSEFFDTYFFPWWWDVLHNQTVRLLNRAAFESDAGGRIKIRLDHLANLLCPDEPGAATLDQIDTFFTETVKVPKTLGGERGVAAYLGLLAHAADAYIKNQYRIEE